MIHSSLLHVNISFCIKQQPTEPSKQPIRTRYLDHMPGYQPIRDHFFLIRSVSVKNTYRGVWCPRQILAGSLSWELVTLRWLVRGPTSLELRTITHCLALRSIRLQIPLWGKYVVFILSEKYHTSVVCSTLFHPARETFYKINGGLELTSNKFRFPVVSKIAGEWRFSGAGFANDDKASWSFMEFLELRFIFVEVVLWHSGHLHNF